MGSNSIMYENEEILTRFQIKLMFQQLPLKFWQFNKTQH